MKCDVDFSSWGREHMICQLVYDQEVLLGIRTKASPV